MTHPLEKMIEDLSNQAREHESWLYDNIGHPQWNSRVSKYMDVLFRLVQKRQQLQMEDKAIPYIPTRNLPRFINKSENVTR